MSPLEGKRTQGKLRDDNELPPGASEEGTKGWREGGEKKGEPSKMGRNRGPAYRDDLGRWPDDLTSCASPTRR